MPFEGEKYKKGRREEKKKANMKVKGKKMKEDERKR
jgi:hypothetical protein